MNNKTLRSERMGLAERGYVLAMAALLMTGMIGFTALAVDLGSWFARASFLQRTADAASLAAVTYMPNFGRAQTEVDNILERNGIEDGVDGVTVLVEPEGNARLRVTISDNSADQFFSGLFTNDVTVTRGAMAEYIKPVPMGSPRNFLGTNDMFSGATRENFFLAIQGYCSRREHGDRITPFADAVGGNNVDYDSATMAEFDSCIPGSPANVRKNVYYNGDPNGVQDPDRYGYYYAIELDNGNDTPGEAWPFAPLVEVYDAPFCTAGVDGGTMPASDQVDYVVRGSDSPLDPTQATQLSLTTVTGGSGTNASCNINGGTSTTTGGYRGRWRQLGNALPAVEGTYYLQVRPRVPTTKSGSTAMQQNNRYALRVRSTNWSTASPPITWGCTADANVATAEAPVRAGCPRLYALTHLGIYAEIDNADPTFFLADIGQEHAGKEVTVELFDTAEGANGVSLRSPAGANIPFEWEIACQDDTYRSESGNCTTGERAPNGGYGGTSTVGTTFLNVSGNWGAQDTTPRCSFRPWSCNNGQAGKYSDRLIRLKFTLPTVTANPTWYGQGTGAAWFKIFYDGGANLGDRTTWSVQIKGDPVRLVE
jgi:hypothetical protein